jgi:hypothetical protein
LHGVLQGAWVVRTEWVAESLRLGRPAAEASFEVSGDVVVEGAPRAGRQARAAGRAPLFAGVAAALRPPFDKMTEAELADLLRDGGATVLAPGAAPPPGARLVCISSGKPAPAASAQAAAAGEARVSQAWVLDSISHFALQPLAAYAAGGSRTS